jgi:DNA-binding NarL/FixJ family response regulator
MLCTIVRIVIVDDQRMIQDSLVSALGRSLTVELVGSFCSGKALLAEPDIINRADVALIDLNLGTEQAFDFLPELRRVAPAVKLIWVTSVATEFLLNRALKSGLEGFVHKTDPISVLVTAIERVAGGATFVSESALRMQARFRKNAGPSHKRLSECEQELMSLLGQGLSNEEAAALLGLSMRTVQTHRQNIMGRLNLHSAAELQNYALRAGFTTPERIQGPLTPE